MFTSLVVMARPCKMRAWSALATFRARLGMSAATLAFRRPNMTNIQSVCRARDHPYYRISPYSQRHKVLANWPAEMSIHSIVHVTLTQKRPSSFRRSQGGGGSHG